MLELVPDPPPDRDWTRHLLIPAAVLLCASAGYLGWTRAFDPLRALPAAQSQQLYESNLSNFAVSCSAPYALEPGALGTFCRKEAALLRRLSDCGPSCQQVTRAFASAQPTR